MRFCLPTVNHQYNTHMSRHRCWLTVHHAPLFPLKHYEVRGCGCDYDEAVIFPEDTQKVYRCALCGSPYELNNGYPSDKFQLRFIFMLNNHHAGEEREFLCYDLDQPPRPPLKYKR